MTPGTFLVRPHQTLCVNRRPEHPLPLGMNTLWWHELGNFACSSIPLRLRFEQFVVFRPTMSLDTKSTRAWYGKIRLTVRTKRGSQRQRLYAWNLTLLCDKCSLIVCFLQDGPLSFLELGRFVDILISWSWTAPHGSLKMAQYKPEVTATFGSDCQCYGGLYCRCML